MIDFIFNKFFAGVLVGCYLYAAYFLILKLKKENKKMKSDFFSTLISALKKDNVSSLDDIYIFYKGTFKLESDNNVYINKVNSLLREFLVYIHIPHLKNFQDVSEDEIKKWKVAVNGLIKKNEEQAPFSKLPEMERSILNDISTFIDFEDYASVKRKLLELSTSIQLRAEQLNKIEKKNKWSMPLTVIGLVLTIYFGIASLI